MRSRSRFERLCAALVHWSELEGTAAQLRRGTERAGRGGASLWGSNGPAGPPGRGQPGTERSSCSCPRSAPPSTATMSNGSGMGGRCLCLCRAVPPRCMSIGQRDGVQGLRVLRGITVTLGVAPSRAVTAPCRASLATRGCRPAAWFMRRVCCCLVIFF